MSVSSYSSYEATFPKDTKLNNQSYLYDQLSNRGDRYHIYIDRDGCYYDTFLEELIALFGKPLDKVAGLSLEANYHLYEDDGWQFTITIEDGVVECSQTEIVWKDCTPEEVGVDIGRPNVRAAKRVWEQLGDVCVDDDDRIDEDVRIFCDPFYHRYYKGTHREQIWHDIEDDLHVSVAYLMGEAKNPDGTN